MGTLSVLRHDDEREVYKPLCAREGDVFETITFFEPPLNMLPGAVCVIHIGREEHGWTHAIEIDGYVVLARLFFKPDSIKVNVVWLHADMENGEYSYKKLKILGCLVELYPTGDLNVCVIQYQEGMYFSPPFDLPYLVPKFRR